MFNNKSDLDGFVAKVINDEITAVSDDVLLDFRNAFLNELLQGSWSANTEYLGLIKIYSGANLAPEPKFDVFIDTATNYFDSLDNATEQLILLNLKTICLILNSQTEQALKWYLFNIAKIDFDDILNGSDLYSLIIKICNCVKFELFYEICKMHFNLDFFFSLSKTVQRNILNNHILLFWNFLDLHVNKGYKEIYELMLKVFNEHLRRVEISEAMCISYVMCFFRGNVEPNFKKINLDVIEKIEPYFKDYAKTLRPHHTNNHKKIKIGFIRGRIVANSPYKVEYSLIGSLLKKKAFRDKFEIYVYSINTIEQSIDHQNAVNDLLNLGVVDVKNPSMNDFLEHKFHYDFLNKANIIRDEIINDEIDILIDFLSANTIIEFLFATRTAKTQIFWSHGNADYDIKDIDLRMSHFVQSNKFDFKLLPVPMDIKFYNPPVDRNLIINERKNYPKDSILLGTIGRLVKIEDESYLSCVCEILKQNESTVYLACGSGGDVNKIKSIVSKFGVLDRFYFVGSVNPDIYGHIIDIFLDTFPPYEQGESRNEFKAKGGATVQFYRPNITKIADEKIQEIKFNKNKFLIYIENIDNFNQNIKEYNDFIANEQYILLTDKAMADPNLSKKSIKGDTKYFDIKLRVENDRLSMIEVNLFVYKSTFKEYYWYHNKLAQWCLENRHLSLINENDTIAGYFTAFDEATYIARAGELIKNNEIRKQYGDFNKAYMQAYHDIYAAELVDKLEEYICQK